ncbi:hypothetical protein UC35_14770 [Ramlibacter tataouinensis]|uniref:Uncharacterized protein n=2 Tax=Ramlibacter tataouinensis TaxID=94132 RepID=A0A127JV65_9BURK|nr:hypothetical protein UC35_14770 [Ramlibacter tataouinensis]
MSSGSGAPRALVLGPEDTRSVRLRAWLTRNPTGWSSYWATPPGHGIRVSAGELRLHFVETSVIACHSRKGCVYKQIKSEEYAFLRDEP